MHTQIKTEHGAKAVSPEYPQSPAAHRNRPTTISTSGSTSHCDKDVRAGHKKAAKGNAGVRTRTSDRDRRGLSMSLSVFLAFRRGLCGAGLGADMITAWDEELEAREQKSWCLVVQIAEGHFGVRASPDWGIPVELDPCAAFSQRGQTAAGFRWRRLKIQCGAPRTDALCCDTWM